MSHSPLLMNHRRCWWSVADEPLPISHSPSPISPLFVSKSPATLRLVRTDDAFPFIGDILKCYFSSHRCWFSTHSSSILDDSHSSLIQTFRDEVFTVDLDHFQWFGISKIFFFFELADTLLSSYLKLIGECVLYLFKNCIVVLFLKIYDFVFCDSYLGTDPLEMRFLGCLVVVLYQVCHLMFLLIFNIFAFVFSMFLWLWWVLLAKSY